MWIKILTILPKYVALPVNQWPSNISFPSEGPTHVSEVSVRGTLGGIAFPPAMLSRIPVCQGERLLLYHYTSDTLCQWKPGPATLRIASRSSAVTFGNAEHSYGHWLDLVLPVGEHTLWKLLRSHADIACPMHRDAFVYNCSCLQNEFDVDRGSIEGTFDPGPLNMVGSRSDFFFELCCARHYNCGSHWAVLVLSLLDNGITRKGQGQWKKQNQTTPKNQKNNPSPTNRVKGETRWNRLSRQTIIPGSHNVFSRK